MSPITGNKRAYYSDRWLAGESFEILCIYVTRICHWLRNSDETNHVRQIAVWQCDSCLQFGVRFRPYQKLLQQFTLKVSWYCCAHIPPFLSPNISFNAMVFSQHIISLQLL